MVRHPPNVERKTRRKTPQPICEVSRDPTAPMDNRVKPASISPLITVSDDIPRPTDGPPGCSEKTSGRAVLLAPLGLTMRKVLPMIASQHSTLPVCAQSSSTPFDIAQAIEQHLPLVQKVARMAYDRYGRRFEHDDLVGFGHLGLVRAAHKYAALQYDIRQAIDFTIYAEKRIWRGIEGGRDRMATIHRWQYRRIKRGEIAAPKIVHESNEYCLADALTDERAADWSDPAPVQTPVAAMLAWLEKTNPRAAQIIAGKLAGESSEQIGQRLGISTNAVDNASRRTLNLLRWRYNPKALVRDDNAPRRHWKQFRTS